MAATKPRLYVLPGSHPCAAVEVALESKGIAYDRVVLLPLMQLMVGPLRYGGRTVPGIRIGSERIVGSRAIMRRLDELAPQPPLLPAPGEPEYARVLEAERWGDEVLQSVPRRLLDAGFLRDAASMESYAGDAKMPLPRPMLRPALPLTAKLMALLNKATDENARADLQSLGQMLDRVDGWIAEGLLGGERPNAADLQIGSTIRLLWSLADVRALLDGRPAMRLVEYFPPMVGEIPPGTLPSEWTARAAAVQQA